MRTLRRRGLRSARNEHPRRCRPPDDEILGCGGQVGCPFIPLSTNSHKTSGVVEHLGWHLRQTFDATAIGPLTDQIVMEAKRLHANHDAYSGALEQRAKQMKDESAQHFIRLREILAAKPTSQFATAVNA